MAKQSGILPIKGTIDNITFYQSQDGFLARKKGGLSGNRIATDPAFARTRENNAEFGRAGAAGKLVRTAFRALISSAGDSRVTSRLTTVMMKVIKGDITSDRGSRGILNSSLSLLQGFEFNVQGKLTTTIYAPYTTAVDRTGGNLTLDLPAFVPAHMIAAPTGATHFKLVAGAAAVNFTHEGFVTDVANPDIQPLSNTPTEATSFTLAVGAASTDPLLLVFGVQFFQELNGGFYQLKNGAYNALAIVAVDLA